MLKIQILSLFLAGLCAAQTMTVTGTVTDTAGQPVADARVTFASTADPDSVYEAFTFSDGTYELSVPGRTSGLADAGVFTDGVAPALFPNPFSGRTALFLDLARPAEADVAVFDMRGRRVRQLAAGVLPAGPHRILWQADPGTAPGMYLLYTVVDGEPSVHRVLYSAGAPAASYTDARPSRQPRPAGTAGKAAAADTTYRLYVRGDGYYGAYAGSVAVGADSVFDVTVTAADTLPFRALTDYVEYQRGGTFYPFFIKGINLGSGMPGRFPSEINVAISRGQYRRWIARMGAAGFNSLRVYTLHPPRFYEELYRYNTLHPDAPLYLFQGIWLRYRDMDFFSTDTVTGGVTLTQEVDSTIHEIVRVVHGRNNVPERGYEAWGDYRADVSRWTAGYLFGREIDPHEVELTNTLHPDTVSYTGRFLSLPSGSATEAWLARRLDNIAAFEHDRYGVQRPVSVSSWPTLDPINHPTETGTEDTMQIDLANLDYTGASGGFFASFHAYPYFPDFMNTDSTYLLEEDSAGQNSYLGYLRDLKDHYGTVPLVVAEYGLPSSWGNGHFAPGSGMHHGTHPEVRQGEYTVRMTRNLYDAACAGGMVFAWMDEWFKDTWLVHALETGQDDVEASHRIKWHNMTSPEQNYGLISFDPETPAVPAPRAVSGSTGPGIALAHDFQYLHLALSPPGSSVFSPGDTVTVGFDTYRADLGESILPGGDTVTSRCEFALRIPVGADTADLYVIPSYDIYGYTIRFNYADTTVQRFRSLPSDSGAWNPMRWMNSHVTRATQYIGRLPMAAAADTSLYPLQAVEAGSTEIRIRIPWTLLHFSDPVEMEVIDGFETAGWLLEVTNSTSDGIAVAAAYDGAVAETVERYTWSSWLYGPVPYVEREKYSLGIIERDFPMIPDVPPVLP